nr:hypothetical protein [[Leptolyngbya] sp. PCC 7376]
MFKDCKTGGYNLESSRVNLPRFSAIFLLVMMAYSLAPITDNLLHDSCWKSYLVCFASKQRRSNPRYSSFTLGLARYGYQYIHPLLRGCLKRV